jgi:hypothetical protein
MKTECPVFLVSDQGDTTKALLAPMDYDKRKHQLKSTRRIRFYPKTGTWIGGVVLFEGMLAHFRFTNGPMQAYEGCVIEFDKGHIRGDIYT